MCIDDPMPRLIWRAYLFVFALLLPLLVFNSNTINWPQGGSMAMTTRQKVKFYTANGTNISTINSNLTQTKLKLLKLAIKRNPFETWFFKNRFKSKADLLMNSSSPWNNGVIQRNHTTKRLTEIIRRALNGENVNIAIMGGSISAGGGLTFDNEDLRGMYYRVFSDWWQKTVEPLTGSVAKLHNLAVGGTSSNFFAFCYSVLLSPNTEMNLVFLDFTVNDYLQFRYSKFPMALSLEQLTREILSERNSPAVMFINFVHGVSKIPMCENLEVHGQKMLAQNYGITAFSLRSFLCSSPSVKWKKFPKMFTSDGNHASILAHAQMALMIINHVRQLMLSVLDRVIRSKEVIVTKFSLPTEDNKITLSDCPLKLSDLPESVFKSYRHDFSEHPLCFTQITPDCTTNNTIHQTLQVTEIGNIGFQVIQKVSINQRSPLNQIQPFQFQTFRTDGYGGWKSQSANSMLELEILIPFSKPECILEGTTPSRNVAVAVRTNGYGGTALLWLNEYEERGVLIDTSSMFGHTKLLTIARHVIPGRHVLSVRTQTPGTFILSGVMIGPTYK